jgi:hypothetical protein
MRALPVTLVIAMTCLATREAAADDLLEALHLEGWYGKVGVESGVAFGRDRGTSPTLGGVATFVHANNRMEWWGAQADLLADWNGDRDTGMRWSVGPELGVFIVGTDVSYFGERIDGATRHGMQVRLKLTTGIAALYLRGTQLWNGDDAKSLEIGIQIKAPVLIKRPRRTYAGESVATR